MISQRDGYIVDILRLQFHLFRSRSIGVHVGIAIVMLGRSNNCKLTPRINAAEVEAGKLQG